MRSRPCSPLAREVVAAYRGVLDRRLRVEPALVATDVEWLHQECLTTALVMLRRRGRVPSPRLVATLDPVLRRVAAARLGGRDAGQG